MSLLHDFFLRSVMYTAVFFAGFPCGQSHTTGAESAAKKQEPKQQITWGQPVNGIRCAIKPKEQEKSRDGLKLSVFEPLLVICYTENQSEQVVKLSRSHQLRMYKFVLTGPDGKAVTLTQFGKLQSEAAKLSGLTSYNLQPSERMMREININHLYDMTVAGDYKLSFRQSIVTADGAVKIVTSNVLTVTVVEPR